MDRARQLPADLQAGHHVRPEIANKINDAAVGDPHGVTISAAYIGEMRRGITTDPRTSHIKALAKAFKIDLDKPVRELSQDQLKVILYGTGDRQVSMTYRNQNGNEFRFSRAFEGVITNLERRYKETNSEYIREKISEFMSDRPCPTCGGTGTGTGGMTGDPAPFTKPGGVDPRRGRARGGRAGDPPARPRSRPSCPPARTRTA